jgi:fructose-1-phosphate kinase PfkB-like protein
VLTEFYEDAPPATVADWEALREMTVGLLPGADWMTLSGSLPPGAPVDGYARLAADGAQAGVPVALDAHGAALAHGVAVRPPIVKVNVAEAADVVPVDAALGVTDRALAAAHGLRARSGGAVVVTCGEDGLVGLAPGGTAWRGRLDVHGPYPVGSGDACLAGLLTALIDGAEWPEALALALGAAAANAEQPGAGSVDGARARDLAAAADVTAVA